MKKIITTCCIIYAVLYPLFFISLSMKSDREVSAVIIPFHIACFIAIAYLLFEYVFPTIVYRKQTGLREKCMFVLNGQVPMIKRTCSGRIGDLSITNALKVELYLRGLIIRIPFMKAIGISYDEVSYISEYARSLKRGIEIRHKSEFIASPIILYVNRNEYLAREIENRINVVKV